MVEYYTIGVSWDSGSLGSSFIYRLQIVVWLSGFTIREDFGKIVTPGVMDLSNSPSAL